MSHRSLRTLLLTAALVGGSVATAAHDWPRCSPDETGFDPAALAQAADRLDAIAGTRTLHVARGGCLVLERSFGAPVSSPHNVKSASKSVLSALVGIAVEQGHLEGVDQPVAELLPEAFRRAGPSDGNDILLRHLLSMTAGLASTSGEEYGAWVTSSDWVEAALRRPRVAEPGDRFTYSTGNSHLISALLTRATGISTLEYARRSLLEPLDIHITAWDESPQGIYFGGNNMALRPRDLLAFGQLYLQKGRWGDRQVVPAEWVERSTRVRSEGWPERYGTYAWLWWVRPSGAFMAVGYGGQFLLVSAADDAVVLLTSTHAGKGAAWDRNVLGIIEEDLLGGITER